MRDISPKHSKNFILTKLLRPNCLAQCGLIYYTNYIKMKQEQDGKQFHLLQRETFLKTFYFIQGDMKFKYEFSNVRFQFAILLFQLHIYFFHSNTDIISYLL